MSLVIVPNSLHDAIYRAIDEQLKLHPDAQDGRDEFYSVLLKHYDEHGEIPEFSLEKKPSPPGPDEDLPSGSQERCPR